MHHIIKQSRYGFAVRVISSFIAITFLFTTILPPGYAQTIGLSLPIPGTMVNLSPAFVPVLLKGMTVHPDNPLKFDFIIDSGNTKFTQDEVKVESERLVKYFLASMTVPQDDLWVNLSPNEKDRIIPEELGKTELGRDLLAQDYILKQLTATLMYPEEELGKKFWDKIYKLAKDQYGITEIPTDTFNKVWIMPESASVYEHENTVYITESHLKVMLDSDYVATMNNVNDRRDNSGVVQLEDRSRPVPTTENQNSDLTKEVIREIILPATDSSTEILRNESVPGSMYKQVIKDIILPEIEKEVNEGKNFAPLRQIYHSLILAKWYKQTVKNSLMSQVYIDQNKTAGIEIADTAMKENIYSRYMDAYKKGVFNYIKEDYDALSETVIPRQYFSGGFKDESIPINKEGNASMVALFKVGPEYKAQVEIKPQDGDEAMLGDVDSGDKKLLEENKEWKFKALSEEALMDEYFKKNDLFYDLAPDDFSYLKDKVVVVTGAGGTIGAEAARQLINVGISKLVLIDKDENGLYAIARELDDHYQKGNTKIEVQLCNLLQENKVKSIFNKYKPNIVFHFANYKSLVFGNVAAGEFANLNLGTTLNLLKVGSKFSEFERFIYISTDKAEKPTQNYGRTKRINELVIRSFADKYKNIKYGVMRYCNVLDAAGSFAIPTFRDQIISGLPITLRVSENGEVPNRYFIPKHMLLIFCLSKEKISP